MNDLDLFGEPIPVASLGELATAINAEHQAAERTARTALDHARAAGEKLLLAKAQVDHGQWLPWLSAHCPGLADRTARAYMRLARNWAQLTLKTATVADLTINDALKLLNAPDSDIDPLESWLSSLLTDSRFPIGTIGWLRDIPPAVVFLDAIGWTTPAIAERLSVPEKTIRALLDPQPFERPDLLRHELNPGLDYLAPVVDRCQREYRWHVAAQLAERRGFFCRGVSVIARKFSRNDLAERFAGMEQVYFREGERAHSKIPAWPFLSFPFARYPHNSTCWPASRSRISRKRRSVKIDFVPVGTISVPSSSSVSVPTYSKVGTINSSQAPASFNTFKALCRATSTRLEPDFGLSA